MLFMVIEHFRNADPAPVHERFVREGRMLPEGVEYLASWIDAGKARCFQLMEAADAEALSPWIARWGDLAEFEVVPVQNAREYWIALEESMV